MKPLVILLASFVLILLGSRLITKQWKWLLSGRAAMAFMLFFTAMGHFLFPVGMAAMIPSIFPMKTEIVYITGVMEILFGLGLLIPKTAKITAWLLILFFLAILPANIYAVMENINFQTGETDGPGVGYLWFRIPLQVFFIAWAYGCTGKFLGKSIRS